MQKTPFTNNKNGIINTPTPASQFIPPETWGEWPFLIKQGKRTEVLTINVLSRYQTTGTEKVDPVYTDTLSPVKIQAAYSSNLTLINNIRYHKHAKIVNNPTKKKGCTIKSIFTLKVYFKKEARKGSADHFVYRSDRFPASCKQQFKNLYDLALKYTEITDTMLLYDNRRAAPDDLLMKWISGNLVFQHELIPFAKQDPPISPGVEILMQDFTINHNKNLHLQHYESIQNQF